MHLYACWHFRIWMALYETMHVFFITIYNYLFSFFFFDPPHFNLLTYLYMFIRIRACMLCIDVCRCLCMCKVF